MNLQLLANSFAAVVTPQLPPWAAPVLIVGGVLLLTAAAVEFVKRHDGRKGE